MKLPGFELAYNPDLLEYIGEFYSQQLKFSFKHQHHHAPELKTLLVLDFKTQTRMISPFIKDIE
jgi:hypothetical protein